MSMEENKKLFGTGIKVWSILCIVAGVFGAISNFALGAIVMAIVGLAVPGLYIWLLIGKKRLTFYLIIAAVAIIFVLNIALYKANFVIALLGFVNPLITYAFLSKYWREMK